MTSTPLKTCLIEILPNLRKFVFTLPMMAVAILGCTKEQDNREQRISRANDYFAAEQYVKAEKEYQEILRLTPDDPTAVHQLAIIYYDQGQIPQAYPLLKKSAELRPDDLAVQLKLAQIYFAGRDYQQARDSAIQILDKQPGYEEALMLLVDATNAPEDMEETRKLVENLRDRDQDRAGYHLARGALDLRQKKDEASAEREFKEALELDPRSSAAHLALGNLYLSRQDLNAADQAFKTAADLAPPRSPI